MFKECVRRTIGELKGGDIIFSIISLWGKHPRIRANKSKVNNPIRSKFEIVRALCLSSLPARLTKIQSKVTEKSWRHLFFTAQGFRVAPK